MPVKVPATDCITCHQPRMRSKQSAVQPECQKCAGLRKASADRQAQLYATLRTIGGMIECIKWVVSIGGGDASHVRLMIEEVNRLEDDVAMMADEWTATALERVLKQRQRLQQAV